MNPMRGLILAALFWMLGAAAMAAPSFPPLSGRVVDGASLLSPATEQRLDSELANLEATTGRQLVVATVPDLQGYEIEDYGYQLGRAWGLGSKDKDDGAILLVAPKERKVRIEVGYGLEPILTDALSSVILQTAVLPAFREGKMEAGVIAGTEAVIGQLALPKDEAAARAAQAATLAKAKGGQSQGLGVPFIFIILILFWIIGGITRGRRGGRGGSALWLLPMILSGGRGGRGGGWGGGGGGGFGGGGGSFGGGGSSGSW